MNLKNKRILHVEKIDFADYVTVVDVDSLPKLEDLQDRDEWILETDEAHYLLKDRVAFRVIKPNATPTVFKSLKFEASPDSFSCKVELEPDALLSFALKNRLPLFENTATQEYLLPSDVFLYAKKPQQKDNTVKT